MQNVTLLLVLPLFVLNLQAQEYDLIPYQLNGKWGFVDTAMNLIIQARYDSVSIFKNERSIVKLNNSYGAIKPDGSFVLKPKYKVLSMSVDFGEFAAMNKNGNECFFNKNGKRIKELGAWDYCGEGIYPYFNTQDYSVRKDDKIALIYTKVMIDDQQNSVFVKDTSDYVFTSIESYGADSFIVRDTSGAGIWAPKELYLKISFDYDDIQVTKGLFRKAYLHKFEKNGLYGLMDVYANIVCEAKYRSIIVNCDGRLMDKLIKVEYKTGKYGYVDVQGHEYF